MKLFDPKSWPSNPTDADRKQFWGLYRKHQIFKLKVIAFMLALWLSPYVIDLAFHHQHPNPHAGEWQRQQSWDQENLKRHDHGCPTAIYVAPHGELRQCQ